MKWQDVIDQILERTHLLLIFLGVACFVLGAAGGLKKDWLVIEDTPGRVVISLFGLVLVVIGVIIAIRNSGTEPNGKAFDIKIDSPGDRDAVDIVNVRGRIRKRIPKDYILMIFRIYPQLDNAIYPLYEVTLNDDGKSWYALNCHIGGSTGHQRILGAYLVGPSGQALIKYFKEAESRHGEALAQAKASLPATLVYLPLITRRTKDMIKGAEVRVTRR
jgi:hypothetical protein